MFLLALLFAVTALLYASIGFGGGSTYNALLVLNGVDYRLLPSIALTCNIAVVAGGAWRFSQAGFVDLKKLNPWIVASVPAAFLGGRIPVSETLFIGLLGFALAFAGVRLLLESKSTATTSSRDVPAYLASLFGAALGLLSGVVGIGGGIFLAPILHMQRWGGAKQIAGACSIFILVNSLAGLFGQTLKLDAMSRVGDLADFWPLLLAVVLGGQIGSKIGTSVLPEAWMKRMTGLLVLYVAIRLLLRWRLLMLG